MDKQENRATGAGGVVLSEDVVDAMIGGFEYLWKIREVAKRRPVRVVPT